MRKVDERWRTRIVAIVGLVAGSVGLLPLGFAADSPEATEKERAWRAIERFFAPPPELATDLGDFASPLAFRNGKKVVSADDWSARRTELVRQWHLRMGDWPKLLDKPTIEIVETTQRDGLTQHKIVIEVAAAPTTGRAPPGAIDATRSEGYLLIPLGTGAFPAVFVPFYEPATSAGLMPDLKFHHDYGYQLAKRGYVTLSIGTPGSQKAGKDTRECLVHIGEQYHLQPLSFLAYVAANCHTALSQRPEVDPQRIGVVGLSYGGKWSMFASCLYDKFTCACWADPGIVYDESNSNINYYEPWYLGYDLFRTKADQRKPGRPSDTNPRTGLYAEMMRSKQQLVDFHALMAPRPVLVSGGTEDKVERWKALNHLRAVYKLLGHEHRIGLTLRPTHAPDKEAAEQTYQFFDVFLKHASVPPSATEKGAKGTAGVAVPRDASPLIATQPETLAVAIDRGLERLTVGAANYPNHRDCFSCHHQTLPLMALRFAGDRGFFTEHGRNLRGQNASAHPPRATVPVHLSEAAAKSSASGIHKFTHKSFTDRLESLQAGKGIGGSALTVSYGLWAFDLAEAPADETSAAMVSFLLQTQKPDGSWTFNSHRPPGASSVAMTTAISLFGLSAYHTAEQSAAVEKAMNQARKWYRQRSAAKGDLEELTGQFWGASLLGLDRDALVAELRANQRSDGGWGQTIELPSDAYATGQALVMLDQWAREAAKSKPGSASQPATDPAISRGVRFLLNSQEPDGSWYVKTRAKPVQKFFDNGDPHGVDQFISTMATAWATSALALSLPTDHPSTYAPLTPRKPATRRAQR